MSGRRHTEAKEMMRIQGCYMYMINNSGKIGAFLGFKTLTIVVTQCNEDVDPANAFLQCYRWFYPLSRSFAPIYVWGPDKMIFPEPFSPLEKPSYIIIRLPYAISEFQKATLWNLIDMFAHVRGRFQKISAEEREALERRYFLTEMFPYDISRLNEAPPNKNAPDIKVLEPLTFPQLSYKGKPYVERPIKLSVALVEKQKCCLPKGRRSEVTPQVCCYLPSRCDKTRPSIVPPSHVREMPKTSAPREKEKITAGGVPHDWVSLPDNYGNILRQYLLGPRDPQHIKITTVPMAVSISEVVHAAVKQVYRKQVALRAAKELKGVPPSFEGRRERLLHGFGEPPKLNAFGPALSSPYPKLVDIEGVTKRFDSPYAEALTLQNLEIAAAFFDHALETCDLLLLSCEPDSPEVNKMNKDDLTLALTPRPIHVRYNPSDPLFATLMTLTQCIENEIIYKPTTNYFERVNEDCEHHYPKLRPRNPYLDPAFVYSRYVPKYRIPT
ncbi:hypothetical protein SprV_0100062700 [Sparganum proliferum]